MKNIIKVGIIGIGGVGEVILKTLLRHPLTEVVAIHDVNTERLMQIASEYKIPAYNSVTDILDITNLDLVYIGVPPKYHHSIALQAIQRKKHVFCEKPLANTLEEANEMLFSAEQNNVFHAINFPTIYRPAFQALREHIKSGYIGELRRIELGAYFPEWPRKWQQNNWINSREQGGFVREVFPHYIQMIQMLFGELYSIRTIIEYPKDQRLSEKGIVSTSQLSDGTQILFIGVSEIGREEEINFTVDGTEGSLTLKNWTDLWITRKNEAAVKVQLPTKDHLFMLIDELIKGIQGRKASVVTFKEGLKVQQVLEELLKAQSK